jgi:hypothetical protein
MIAARFTFCVGELTLMQALLDIVVHGLPVSLPFI